MYPGTISFQRFDFPSHLSESIQKKMENIATRYLRGVGFNNSLFNIEFMYDSKIDKVAIIEVNPRMSAQFADFYEKVYGLNSYEIALDIAAGRRPDISKGRGKFQVASSCVLRLFEDKFVQKIPSADQIDSVMKTFSDVRIEITAKEGKRLSEVKQDVKSYRYCVINLGGKDLQEILTKLEHCKEMLQFELR